MRDLNKLSGLYKEQQLKLERKIGVSHRILFDELDWVILAKVMDNPRIQIMKLVEMLKITHKNLKPHIDRLVGFNFITVRKNQQKKSLFLTPKGHFCYLAFGEKELNE